MAAFTDTNIPPPALVKLSAARTSGTGLAVKFMFDSTAKRRFLACSFVPAVPFGSKFGRDI